MNIKEESLTPGTSASTNSSLGLMLKNFVLKYGTSDRILFLNGSRKPGNRKILIIPGIEGTSTQAWMNLANGLEGDTYVLQTNDLHDANTIEQLHNKIIKDVNDLYKDDDTFVLIGFSLGTILALSIAESLESIKGMRGSVVMIEGSPMYFKKFFSSCADTTDETIQSEIFSAAVRTRCKDTNDKILKQVLAGENWDMKMENFFKFCEIDRFEKRFFAHKLMSILNHIKMTRIIDEDSFPQLKLSKIYLIKATRMIAPMDIDEDYGLNFNCLTPVESISIKGDHISILNEIEIVNFISLIV